MSEKQLERAFVDKLQKLNYYVFGLILSRISKINLLLPISVDITKEKEESNSLLSLQDKLHVLINNARVYIFSPLED